MSKYIISNIYSPKNIGDRAIVEGVVFYIKSINPDADIYCLSKYSHEFITHCKWKGARELIHLPVNSNKIYTLLAPLLHVFRFGILFLAYSLSKKLTLSFLPNNDPFGLIANAKFVAVAGGNYLFSSNKSYFSRTMLVHLLNIYLPTLLGKKVYVFPQSIGPFYRKYESALSCAILNRTRTVMTRDHESHDYLIENGVASSKVVTIPDIAFLLSSNTIKFPRTKLQRVLITVLDWSWGFDKRTDKSYEAVINNYKLAISGIINYLSAHLNLDVHILAHVTVEGSNDLLISNQIAENTDPRVKIIDMSQSDIYDVVDFYNKYDLIIGSRMHSCILAIGQGIPTIGLAYQPKGLGLYNLLSLQEFSIDANNFTYDELKLVVDSVWANYSYVANIFATRINELHSDMKAMLNDLDMGN